MVLFFFLSRVVLLVSVESVYLVRLSECILSLLSTVCEMSVVIISLCSILFQCTFHHCALSIVFFKFFLELYKTERSIFDSLVEREK